jgi:hypothetical protein
MMWNMVVAEGLLLGIASGGACLAYCAPVLIPYLLGEARTVGGNAVLVGCFLGGRLIGYLSFGVLAWLMHVALVEDLPHRTIMAGLITIGLAVLLIAYGFAGRSRTVEPGLSPQRSGGCTCPGLGLCRPC